LQPRRLPPQEKLSRRAPLGVINHFIDRRGEIINPSTRDDDGIPPSVRFFGDAEKLAAIVLAELDVEIFPFDLQLPRLNEIIHVCKKPRSLGRLTPKRKADFLVKNGGRKRSVNNGFKENQRRLGCFLGNWSAIAKSICFLNVSTRATKTRISSPTLNRRFVRRPIRRRWAASNR